MNSAATAKHPGCLPRVFFYGLSTVAWGLVLGAALESYARWDLKRDEAAALAYGNPLVEQAFARDYAEIAATADAAPKPPAELVRPLPPRATFHDGDDVARQALAETRRELILVVRPEGAVRAVYAGNSRPEAAALAQRAGEATTIRDLLPDAEAADATRALAEAANGAVPPPREYTVLVGEGAGYVSEWSFEPQPDDTIAVFVRDSMWQVLWRDFRGDMYGENFYDRWANSVFWTNAQGHRDDPVVLPKPRGTVRIACVGGSTTVEGPRNDLTYPNMVERQLREAFHTNAIEVINCGVYTVDTGRTLQRLPGILELDPDLVVQYNFVNDAASLLPNWLRPESLFHTPGKWVKDKLRSSVFMHRHFNRWLLPSRGELRQHIEETVIANLRAMKQLADAAGVPMAFGSFAAPGGDTLTDAEADFFYLHSNRLWGWSVDTRSYKYLVEIYNEALRDFCMESGALYLPIAENVAGGLEAFTDICHMHLDAMREKARVVVEGVRPLVDARLEAVR